MVLVGKYHPTFSDVIWFIGWRGHTLAAGLAFAILRLGLMLATVQMSRPLARSDRSPITTVYYKLACDRTGYLVRL